MKDNNQKSNLVGFFPKVPCPKPRGFKSEKIKEICSVSECIAQGPENWIHKWEHNNLGFFDTEDKIIKILENDKEQYHFYAYKLYPFEFTYNDAGNYSISVNLDEDLSNYDLLGFDIVSRSMSDFFECSPLSCNGIHEIYPVNQYCLIDKFEDAYKYCLEIEKQKCEPGPYYLFEVHRKRSR